MENDPDDVVGAGPECLTVGLVGGSGVPALLPLRSLTHLASVANAEESPTKRLRPVTFPRVEAIAAAASSFSPILPTNATLITHGARYASI